MTQAFKVAATKGKETLKPWPDSTAKYSHVRDILANGRDHVSAATTPEWTSPQHAHVRGPEYYQ